MSKVRTRRKGEGEIKIGGTDTLNVKSEDQERGRGVIKRTLGSGGVCRTGDAEVPSGLWRQMFWDIYQNIVGAEIKKIHCTYTVQYSRYRICMSSWTFVR